MSIYKIEPISWVFFPGYLSAFMCCLCFLPCNVPNMMSLNYLTLSSYWAVYTLFWWNISLQTIILWQCQRCWSFMVCCVSFYCGALVASSINLLNRNLAQTTGFFSIFKSHAFTVCTIELNPTVSESGDSVLISDNRALCNTKCV